jgi:hypothetical protein
LYGGLRRDKPPLASFGATVPRAQRLSQPLVGAIVANPPTRGARFPLWLSSGPGRLAGEPQARLACTSELSSASEQIGVEVGESTTGSGSLATALSISTLTKPSCNLHLERGLGSAASEQTGNPRRYSCLRSNLPPYSTSPISSHDLELDLCSLLFSSRVRPVR